MNVDPVFSSSKLPCIRADMSKGWQLDLARMATLCASSTLSTQGRHESLSLSFIQENAPVSTISTVAVIWLYSFRKLTIPVGNRFNS